MAQAVAPLILQTPHGIQLSLDINETHTCPYLLPCPTPFLPPLQIPKRALPQLVTHTKTEVRVPTTRQSKGNVHT